MPSKKEKYIRQRPDGRWEARIRVGRREDGSSDIPSRYFSSRTEARAYVQQVLEDRAGGVERVRAGMTLAEWAEECLEIYGPGLQDYTRTGYRSKIRCYILPAAIARRPLERVTKVDLQRWVNDLKKADGTRPAPKTVRLAVGVMVWLLGRAVESGVIASAPDTAHLRLPPAEKPHRQVITPEEATALLKASEDSRIYAALVVDACTGLRRSELLGLAWDDMDLTRGTYSVRRKVTIEDGTNEPRVEEMLKSRSAERVGQLPPEAIRVMKHHKALQAEEKLLAGAFYRDNGLCFPDEIGRPQHPQRFSSELRRLSVKAIGREVGLHELRHMVATALIRAHLDDATIANALGHRNADFTRRIYADIYDDSREQVAAVTEKLINI